MSFGDLNIDRDTLGFHWLPVSGAFVKWKVLDLIYFVSLFCFDWFFLARAEPFQRQFTINDLTISHPFAEHERVTTFACIALDTLVPLICISASVLLLTPKQHKVHVWYITIVGLGVTITTNSLVTDVLKNWVGRCRPDFLARCIPKEDAVKDTLYLAKDICTQTDHSLLMDGFRTTPSGHSSGSFSGLGYLTFWLCGQLTVFKNRTSAWRIILAGLPTLLAAYIALSRTQDYRHHFVDILLGSLLGSIMAWWGYRRYYPELTSGYCYEPYTIIDEKKLTEFQREDEDGFYLSNHRSQEHLDPLREIV
ncbi:unnamed protein product [Kuraishia capsulata CBS 1993]|uniref:Phosphatidic acid phosphatase type 2/haloperoxidase domain-containing protein n=1 Tax=Kuraishia capsulata CBS 1993 TaxID=1382522 RepID=W6MGT9_9ASCO|nr:uncharacterized protein KUCA_T00000785001 [Kuraishia capsulata CBS 1993]CDK24818.1 unnamed protein product [Kuraishia capsulata CBS 1993]